MVDDDGVVGRLGSYLGSVDVGRPYQERLLVCGGGLVCRSHPPGLPDPASGRLRQHRCRDPRDVPRKIAELCNSLAPRGKAKVRPPALLVQRVLLADADYWHMPILSIRPSNIFSQRAGAAQVPWTTRTSTASQPARPLRDRYPHPDIQV